MAYEFVSKSSDETRSLGRRLGELLRSGDTVLLYGDIGMGKTVFVNGLAAALGIAGPVASPTFTIASVYDVVPPFYHFDAYRVDGPDELSDTGFYDYAGGEGVLALEWAERLCGRVPADRVEVRIGGVPVCDTESRKNLAIDSVEPHRFIRIEFFGRGAEREHGL